VKNKLIELESAPEITGRVLIVDDEKTTRALHRTVLSKQFDVVTADSGEEALKICRAQLPDLVLLDVMMPEMDGFETCQKLREFTDIPIIFATANDKLEEHLKAFDAGGDDIIAKPVVKEILLRKVSLAIQSNRVKHNLKTEKDSMQSMAMSFLSAAGESGVLQQFMQVSLTCNSPKVLGEQLVEAIRLFGLECSVLIRDNTGSPIISSYNPPSEIERSILEHSASMGRIFQFKQKMVVNYDRVSVIVDNMPAEETEKSGRLRDNITILAEMTDTLCENVSMRQTSHARAEQFQVAMTTNFFAIESLREMSRNTQLDIRILLQELIDNVDKSFAWLGTSRNQEKQINQTMHVSVEKILGLLETSRAGTDEKFEQVLTSLREGDGEGEIDLF